MDSDDIRELLEAFDRATYRFKLCPNRVWAVARGNLAELMPDSLPDSDLPQDNNVERSEQITNCALSTPVNTRSMNTRPSNSGMSVGSRIASR